MQYEYADTKLILDEDELQTCVDELFIESKKDYSRIERSFSIIRLYNGCNDIIESLFPKELANIVNSYNGKYNKCKIIMEKDRYEKIRVIKNNNYLSMTAFNFYKYDGSIDELYIYGKKIMYVRTDELSCLKYMFDNNMFTKFIQMNPDELYAACAHISRDILKIEDYPSFFILMHNIKKHIPLDNLIVMHIICNIFSKKLTNTNS